ncbi:addiction module HigA family antidote [Pedobacter sp. UYP30]|uniref:HigA family addiction module antitoxin n=1 Tax=Pedobacter sp. UYP30 TaxID=1756400 RepID=UPI003398CF7C
MERGISENTHPGEIFREEILKANNLNVKETAELLKVARPTLSNVVNCKASISPNMALRIAKVFGGTPAIWLKLQTSYDLREAEKEFKNNAIYLDKYVYAS